VEFERRPNSSFAVNDRRDSFADSTVTSILGYLRQELGLALALALKLERDVGLGAV
jgi:hypothetical protein